VALRVEGGDMNNPSAGNQKKATVTESPTLARAVGTRPTSPGKAPILSVEGLTKSYSANGTTQPVLGPVNLTVAAGEFVSVVGPSGVGKTTLLRCLCGLTAPTAGQVTVAGRPVTEPPPEVAVVFQDYSSSLLPWMRAGENVAFPLRGKGMSKAKRKEAALRALEAVNLASATAQYPWEMSGGMQQRVAIARALACEPDIMLMDEPFASVDAQTRFDLEDLVARLARQSDRAMTFVLVTHDIDEAVYLSDRVVVLAGRPATVTDDVAIPLPQPRTQLGTRAEPAFTALRTQVLGGIVAHREGGEP
jgi:NitT/TauT family transport system ATP-binding protein